MGCHGEETIISRVSYYTPQEEGIVKRDAAPDIQLGPIPYIRDPIEIHIGDRGGKCAGRVCFENTRALTVVPGEATTRFSTDANGDETETILEFGPYVRVEVPERLSIGDKVILSFGEVSGDTVAAEVIQPDKRRSSSNSETSKETSSGSSTSAAGSSTNGGTATTTGGQDISSLVAKMKDFPSAKNKSSPGGSARGKGTCKCCGARVDSGSHKCGLCKDAGCSPWKRQCRFAEM